MTINPRHQQGAMPLSGSLKSHIHCYHFQNPNLLRLAYACAELLHGKRSCVSVVGACPLLLHTYICHIMSWQWTVDISHSLWCVQGPPSSTYTAHAGTCHMLESPVLMGNSKKVLTSSAPPAAAVTSDLWPFRLQLSSRKNKKWNSLLFRFFVFTDLQVENWTFWSFLKTFHFYWVEMNNILNL